MLYRQLEVFRSVIDAGTATGAAKQLNMSQPAVSQHLAQLEDALGVVLFARSGGRLEPTEQALAIYDEVAFAFEGVERVVNLAQSFRTSSSGTLRIAVPHSMCDTLLPRIVARFSADHPNVRFAIELATYEAIVAMVAARRVDLGVAKLPIQHPGVSTAPILDSPLICAVPPQHPLAAGNRVRMADLKNQPLIMIGHHRPWRHEIDAHFRRNGLVPNIRLETHAVHAACGFVAAGVGIAIVPELLATQFNSRGIALRPLSPSFMHRFVVAYPSALKVSALAERFSEDLRAVAEETVKQQLPG